MSNPNPYAQQRENIERCLEKLTQEGVSPFMLYAYAEAKAMERSRMDSIEESRQDDPDEDCKGYTVWDEFDGQVDSAMDEARDFVAQEYDEIGAAMAVIYGERA